MRLLIVWIALSFASPTFAASGGGSKNHLLDVRLPAYPDDVARVFVPVSADCQLGNLDFFWKNLKTGKESPANSIAKCNILDRLPSVPVNPESKVGCPAAARGKICFDKAYSAKEFSVVNHGLKDPSLVVRSFFSKSEGKCKVTASIDANGRPVQLSSIQTAGRVLSANVLMMKFQILVENVSVTGISGEKLAWECTHGCEQTIQAKLSCQ